MTGPAPAGRWSVRVVHGRSGLDKLVEKNRELEQLLAEGWEPFAVASYGGDFIALRRFEPARMEPAIG